MLCFVQAAGTPPPADVCGCQNGGTCVMQTRRGREFKRCLCPSEYRGETCETESELTHNDWPIKSLRFHGQLHTNELFLH